MLKSTFVFLNSLLLFALLFFPGCSGDGSSEDQNTELAEEEMPFYTDLVLPVTTKQKSSWPGNEKIVPKAEVKQMQLILRINLNRFPKQFIPVSATTKDTCVNTHFNLGFFYNGKPLEVELNPLKHRWVYRNGFETKNNKSLDHTTSITGLNKDKYIEMVIPLFAFSKFSSNKQITIDVRLWQDYFLSEEKSKRISENGFEREVYYRDTLKTKLVDNIYSFTLTVPAIYKSDIICDSIVLQNDTVWNPYGSDNTLWKSTLPDVYFTIHDLYDNIQGSSTVEKSTAKFTIGDTVPYFHYVEKEPFYIHVYDFDMLSKNDLLGWQKSRVDRFSNNQNYCLQFGNITNFCFRRKYYGKIN